MFVVCWFTLTCPLISMDSSTCPSIMLSKVSNGIGFHNMNCIWIPRMHIKSLHAVNICPKHFANDCLLPHFWLSRVLFDWYSTTQWSKWWKQLQHGFKDWRFCKLKLKDMAFSLPACACALLMTLRAIFGLAILFVRSRQDIGLTLQGIGLSGQS